MPMTLCAGSLVDSCPVFITSHMRNMKIPVRKTCLRRLITMLQNPQSYTKPGHLDMGSFQQDGVIRVEQPKFCRKT